VTDHELARLRFDCVLQAGHYTKPGAGEAAMPRGLTIDEQLELAGKIEAFCMREREERKPFDFAALGTLRERGAGY
jgi:hypothetical protein